MLLKFCDWLFYSAFGLSADTRWVEALHFFVYDTIKIFALLFGMIFVIGVARTFLSRRKVKAWMGKRSVTAYIFAALFGAVTPFCSCSSIPMFLGFLEAGVPLGVTFTFLVTSPLINEYLVVLMMGFFGWKITAVYVLSGLIIGIGAGLFLGRKHLESMLVRDMISNADTEEEEDFPGFRSRLSFGWKEATGIVRKIWIWVVVGVGLGAMIHNYVPEELIQNLIGKAGAFSVPLAVLLGVPMYGSCAAIVPVAVVLFQKGIPLGTALAFMMAIAALSLPEAVMLRRAMRIQLILLFFAVTTLGIMITGYLFNFLQPFFG